MKIKNEELLPLNGAVLHIEKHVPFLNTGLCINMVITKEYDKHLYYHAEHQALDHYVDPSMFFIRAAKAFQRIEEKITNETTD